MNSLLNSSKKEKENQFIVKDRSHPQSKEIHSFLAGMPIKLKIAGYVPEKMSKWEGGKGKGERRFL